MPSVTLLVLLVILPGVLVLVASFHAALRLNLNANAYLAAMEKLLRNGQRSRAQALSRAADAPVAMVSRRALELRLPRFDPKGRGGDYREAPEQSFEERARQSLAPVARRQLDRFRLSLYSSALVLVSVGGAISLVSREGVGGMAGVGWVALAMGGLAAGLNVRRYQRAKRDVARTIDTIVPFVEPE